MQEPGTNRDLRGRPMIGSRATFAGLVVLLGLAVLVFMVLPKIDFTPPPAVELPPPPSVVAAPQSASGGNADVPVVPRPQGAPEMPGSVAEPGDDVLEDLLASAAEHEARDSWSMALADYRAALERDPESAKARAGRARAETALAQHQFQAAMSRGFAALERGDHGRAVEAFREAQAADPKNPAVRDAMAQAREAVRLARIASLRLEAEAMADQEQWAAAAGVYDRILGIDGNLAFAKAGRARNELLGRTAAQLDYYLDEPELLYSNKARASARLFEKGLAELDTTGAPGLQQRIARFREQLELASEPLPLQIRSDNQTEIIVYHMGRLGRFESKFIELLPGQWTLVGSRPGYRDVRLELNIRPGVTPTPVYIACEEAI